MAPRKRAHAEMEDVEASFEAKSEPDTLHRLRNMWQFANLMQYIFIFGKAVKIDEDLDIEDLEQECLKPEPSQVLSDIGLALLKFVSSHRGLTPEIFDEYARRQYEAKAPLRNPFGIEEEPKKFATFDVYTKIKVLVQLSVWTLGNADRIKERMEETKESEQIAWRIEEIGYDRQGRYYFVLDDNRLYRRTDPPPPPIPKAKPKAKSKKAKAMARAKTRRRARDEDVADSADSADEEATTEKDIDGMNEDDDFGGRQWECVAITLSEYQDFLASIQKSKDADEKALRARIIEDVLPIIEKYEESQVRKRQRQEREMLNMQKLATAKRSSRLEAKFERERQDQEAAEEERRKREALVEAKRDQERQKNMDAARESRMMTREQRLKDREQKRILHEEELANLSEENRKVESGESARSERHLKAELEKKKKDLAALQEEKEWFFDCSKCGVHGTNLDDGSHSIACEKCDVWQHSACLGVSQEAAEKSDFHFVCADCKRREEDAKKPKIPSLKFHVGSSSSPPTQKPKAPKVTKIHAGVGKRVSGDEHSGLPPSKNFKPRDANGTPQTPYVQPNGVHSSVLNGPRLSPQGQMQPAGSANAYASSLSSSTTSPKAGASGPASGGSQGVQTNKPGWQGPSPYPDDRPYQPGAPSNPSPYQAGTGSYAPQQGAYPAYQNGYAYHGYQNNQTPQTHQSPHHQPHSHAGWSAQYNSSSQAAQHHQSHVSAPLPQSGGSNVPPPQNPYVNSFDRQKPQSSSATKTSTSTSHAVPAVLNGPTLSPPVKQVSASPKKSDSPHTMSPPVHAPPAVSLYQPLQTPQPNGHPVQREMRSPRSPTGLPVASPTKHPSPPASSTQPPPKSSPVNNQPPLQPSNVPLSPGLSPQKHSPSVIQPPALFHGVVASPFTLPPAPVLSPSPAQTSFTAPSKADHEIFPSPEPRLVPEQATEQIVTANGHSPVKEVLE